MNKIPLAVKAAALLIGLVILIYVIPGVISFHYFFDWNWDRDLKVIIKEVLVTHAVWFGLICLSAALVYLVGRKIIAGMPEVTQND